MDKLVLMSTNKLIDIDSVNILVCYVTFENASNLIYKLKVREKKKNMRR